MSRTCLQNLAEDLRVDLPVRLSGDVVLEHADDVRQQALRDRPELFGPLV